jgi:hypothetical protein
VNLVFGIDADSFWGAVQTKYTFVPSGILAEIIQVLEGFLVDQAPKWLRNLIHQGQGLQDHSIPFRIVFLEIVMISLEASSLSMAGGATGFISGFGADGSAVGFKPPKVWP